MAKYIGSLTTDIRGKIGGVVMSAARTGVVIKSHGVPRRQPSAAQQSRRQIFAAALYYWRNLGGTYVAGWNTGASGLTWKNSLGQTFVPTGLMLWQQAFMNAALLGTVPPFTYSGTPATIIPVTGFNVSFGATEGSIEVLASTGYYTGTWLAFISRPIPSSLNYTKTLSRLFACGSQGSATALIFPNFGPGYGPLPTSNPLVSVRVLPVHPTTFVSGTPLIGTVEV